MTVYELNQDELDELKQRYFYDDCEECQLYYDFWFNIPDITIQLWYEQFNFVKDDFFCNE